MKKFYHFINRNRLFIGLLLATNSALLSYFVTNYVIVVSIAENHFADIHVALRSQPRPQSENIAVVLINEETVAPLPYRSPLDRDLIADILVDLENRSVTAIGLNVAFDRATELDKDKRLFRVLREIKVPLIVSSIPDTVTFIPAGSEFSKYFLEDIRTGLSHIYRDNLDSTVREILVRRVRDRTVDLGFAAAIANALGVEIPDRERLRIDFRAGPDSNTPPFPIYPAHKLSEVPDSALQGKILLIGSSLGLSSLHRTPLSIIHETGAQYLPGILIEAHALSQLLERRVIRFADADGKLILIIVASVLGILIAFSSMRWILKIILSISVIPLVWIAILITFSYSGLLLPLVTFTLAYILSAIIGFSWEWRTESAKRQRVQQAFGHFLAPTVIAQMLENPQSLELGGEKREITFMFTDLEGFTSLTENNEPKVMVRLVNSYLEESCEIVMRNGGTIDKIVGDALHVMFNAPIFQEDHAQRAVNCAIELDEWSNHFRQRQAENGITLGVTRIGVNTGRCIVGNFGGSKRFDYTAHGDAINSAARLESINQRLGTTICVSESTVNKCPDTIFLPVATLILYGKTQGVDAYYPFTETDEYYHTAFRDEYIYAYSCLRDSKIEASELFRNLLEKYPGHPLVKLHNKRIENGELGTSMVMRKK